MFFDSGSLEGRVDFEVQQSPSSALSPVKYSQHFLSRRRTSSKFKTIEEIAQSTNQENELVSIT